MHAILKVTERLMSKGKREFIEAILILPSSNSKTAKRILLEKEAIKEMIPFGGYCEIDDMKLVVLNHYSKQGFILSGIEPAFITGKTREINFIMQAPADYSIKQT